MNNDLIRLGDLPEDLLKQITDRLHSHSTSLFRLAIDNGGEGTALHIGAGTFATIAGVDGILTATHVVDKLGDDSRLGLLAAREGTTHRFSVDLSTLSVARVAVRSSDAYGPDAAFISFGEWGEVETIKASRAFHLLDMDRDTLLDHRPRLDKGIWSVCGTPEERVHLEHDQVDFETVIAIESYCGVGGMDVEFEREGWDYLEFPLVDKWTTAPANFAGMSGGSIWQITIRRTNQGRFQPADYYLMGVIFYQDVRADGTRFLRCHGPHTIYRNLFNLVTNKYA